MEIDIDMEEEQETSKQPGSAQEESKKPIKSFNPALGISYEENKGAESRREIERSTVEFYEKDIIPMIIQGHEREINELESHLDEAGKSLLRMTRHTDYYKNYVRSRFGWLFQQGVKDFSWLNEVVEIAQKNSLDSEKTWIIGGFVCDSIARIYYGDMPIPEKFDIDFLIKKSAKKLYIPDGWDAATTEYGGISLKRDNLKIDLNYLGGFHSIHTKHTNPHMGHLFAETPLNYQAIAYVPSRKIVLGQKGIRAIEERTVRINNLFEAQQTADRISKRIGKKFTVEDLVMCKAEPKRFSYELPFIGAT